MSPQNVMALALLSALCRACLNIVDRQQIGRNGLSVIGLNFLNNIVPAFFLALFIVFFGGAKDFFSIFFNWRVIAFSGLAQVAAYAYSYAFRHLNVNQVTIASKVSDLFIPIGILWTIGTWSWGNYLFSITTTLVCLPILLTKKNTKNEKIISAIPICLALTLQASFSPLLTVSLYSASPYAILVFSANVMLWRTLWAFFPAALKCSKWLPTAPALLVSPLFSIRVLLTLITQISFIYAVGSPSATLAWPILNVTGFIAMLLSVIFLHEKANKAELFAISSISLLVLVRFLTL